MMPPRTNVEFSAEDRVFVLETDRGTWIALDGFDEHGKATRFRLVFTTLERAREFAMAHAELPARRVREIRVADLTTSSDPPMAIDVDPGSV